MEKGFKGFHPAVNIAFYISVIVLGMVINHPVYLFASLIASSLFYIKLLKKRAVKSLFSFLLPTLIFVTLINALFTHYGLTVLTVLPWGNTLTLEGVTNGLVTGLTVVSVICWFFTYNEVVTADKFMFIFGRFLPNFALVISMALRFVPLYKNKLRSIADAQRGIGKDYRQGNIIERIKNGTSIIIILITWALENAIQTADSMRSRGYGVRGRKIYSRFSFDTRDKFTLLVIFLIDIILIILNIFGKMKCSFNPVIAIPKTDIFGLIGITAYAFLNFLPIIIEGWEEIRWHSLKSKI